MTFAFGLVSSGTICYNSAKDKRTEWRSLLSAYQYKKEGESLFEEPLLTGDCGLTGRFAAVPADLPPKGQLPSTTFRRIKQWIKMT